MNIPLHFNPRVYQLDALRALESGVRIAVLCWARRGGKDFTSFGYAVKSMVQEPMNVVLVFPTKEQGKTSFWENIENDGFKTIDHIPKSLIERKDNTTMRIVLKNGSTFQILGATEADALRGANAKIYIFSEFVDIPAGVLDVIRPVVAANGGQIILISTPKIDGISGATFKILFDRAFDRWENGDKSQYASLVRADEYLTPQILEDLRQENIALYGNDFFWRQEYMCDWGQVSSSSYYGSVLQRLRDKEKIGTFPYDPAHPAYSAWDLGMSDSTAITMFQYIKKEVTIIDYFETHDIGNEPLVSFMKAKPYNFAWHFFPHDGVVRDSDAITRIQKIRDLGLINSSVLRREPVEEGIKRTVEGLAKTRFNEGTTEEQRRKLLLYKRKFNPITGDYLGPEHKTESHAADSTRYVYAAIEHTFNKETGEFLYSPATSKETYETDKINVAAYYRPY